MLILKMIIYTLDFDLIVFKWSFLIIADHSITLNANVFLFKRSKVFKKYRKRPENVRKSPKLFARNVIVIKSCKRHSCPDFWTSVLCTQYHRQRGCAWHMDRFAKVSSPWPYKLYQCGSITNYNKYEFSCRTHCENLRWPIPKYRMCSSCTVVDIECK